MNHAAPPPPSHDMPWTWVCTICSKKSTGSFQRQQSAETGVANHIKREHGQAAYYDHLAIKKSLAPHSPSSRKSIPAPRRRIAFGDQSAVP